MQREVLNFRKRILGLEHSNAIFSPKAIVPKLSNMSATLPLSSYVHPFVVQFAYFCRSTYLGVITYSLSVGLIPSVWRMAGRGAC